LSHCSQNALYFWKIEKPKKGETATTNDAATGKSVLFHTPTNAPNKSWQIAVLPAACVQQKSVTRCCTQCITFKFLRISL